MPLFDGPLMAMPRVIESKVWAATAGAFGGGALSSFILWLVGVVIFGASSSAPDAVAAVGAVPAPVQGLVTLLLSVGGTFLAGYFAPHTDRPDLPAPAAPVVPAPAAAPAAPVPPTV